MQVDGAHSFCLSRSYFAGGKRGSASQCTDEVTDFPKKSGSPHHAMDRVVVCNIAFVIFFCGVPCFLLLPFMLASMPPGGMKRESQTQFCILCFVSLIFDLPGTAPPPPASSDVRAVMYFKWPPPNTVSLSSPSGGPGPGSFLWLCIPARGGGACLGLVKKSPVRTSGMLIR